MTINYQAPPLQDQATLLARTLPDGRVWNSKWDDTRILGRLVRAFSKEIDRLFQRIENFVVIELDPLKTRQLILEWEESVGIPDQCFDRSTSLVERRRRVNQKLTNFGDIILVSDVVELLAEFGEAIALVPGNESNAFDLGFGVAPYTTQELKEIRHTVAVRVESDAPTFALPFPIQFATEQSSLLQCLVERVMPANVALQFFFNENLALPFGTGGPGASNASAILALQEAAATLAGNVQGVSVNGSVAAPSAEAGLTATGIAAQPAFEPTDIADLVLWLDADDVATITDTAGDVSQWDDKSASGFDVVQATGSQQPTISSINGNASLLFDGTDDLLRNPSVAMDIDPVSFAVAFTPTSIAAGSADVFNIREGFDSDFRFSRVTDDFRHRHQAVVGSTLDLLINNVAVVNRSAWSISRMQNAAGGTSDALDDQGNTASATGPTSFVATGDNINIGANANGDFAWAGHIHEIIVYNRVLTAQERTDLAAYLDGKWTV